MSNSQIACYLYCLMPRGCGIKASAIGVDGQRAVSVRACGEIDAVVSEVELGEFCGESAEAHLQDLAWLGPRVCRHEAVVEEVMRRVPVLPLPFGTLFTSVDSLMQSVYSRREAVTGFFAQVGDKQEWAVKGLLNRGEAMERLASFSKPAASSPGTQYFEEKRRRARLESDCKLRLKEFCRGVAARLGTLASGFRERKVLASIDPGTDAGIVLNWAFLLSPAALEDFRVHLDRFNGGEAFPGLMLTLSGPWPPYSFAPDLSASAKA